MGTTIAVSLVVFLVVFVVTALIGFYLWYLYNHLTRIKHRVDNSFAQVVVQLTRRHDLIPNLANCVKGYMKHEQDTLREVIEARNLAHQKAAASTPSDADSVSASERTEAALSGCLGRLLVVIERYPDLKADKTVSQLMEELGSTENRIAFSRQTYNDLAAEFNFSQDAFPACVVSRRFGFRKVALLQLDKEKQEEVQSAPDVSLHG